MKSPRGLARPTARSSTFRRAAAAKKYFRYEETGCDCSPFPFQPLNPSGSRLRTLPRSERGRFGAKWIWWRSYCFGSKADHRDAVGWTKTNLLARAPPARETDQVRGDRVDDLIGIAQALEFPFEGIE